MHECKRSQCTVWVKICELLSGGNINFGNLISMSSFRDEWKSEHQRQQASPPSVVGLFFFFFFFYQPPRSIKLARATENQIGLALFGAMLS